jgi:hypothetical protein
VTYCDIIDGFSKNLCLVNDFSGEDFAPPIQLQWILQCEWSPCPFFGGIFLQHFTTDKTTRFSQIFLENSPKQLVAMAWPWHGHGMAQSHGLRCALRLPGIASFSFTGNGVVVEPIAETWSFSGHHCVFF